VIVEFINGSQSFPVIVGKLNTSDEIEGYYDAGGTKPDYPFFFQNNSKPGTGPSSSSASAGGSNASDSELPEQYRMTASDQAILDKASINPTAGYDIQGDPDLMPVTKWLDRQGVFGN
jgi:hypothetical protein